MSRKKIEDRNVRKLTKTKSGSYYVTLPIEFVRKLRFKDGQKIEFDIDERRGKIIIKDWEK